jgi:hypothetical protein
VERVKGATISRRAPIRYVQVEPGATIGEKRNLGSDLSQGEIIASWDDDDWSAPSRISDQINRMQQSGKAVTGYHSMLFTDGSEWWKFKGHSTSNLGTSLCYRKDWWVEHRFPSKKIGEDAGYIESAVRAQQFISADAGELMVATIHKGNTSPRQLSGDSWKRLEGFSGIPEYSQYR